MKRNVTSVVFVLALAAGFAAPTRSSSVGAVALSASAAQSGQLHVTKNCSDWHGYAGDFCTITISNLSAIAPNARVYYDQAFGTPTGFLDSDVLLHVGTGDWAVGHCTLDGSTYRGLCTFSDGVGQLAGFSARVNVSPAGGLDFNWDGTYSFAPPPR